MTKKDARKIMHAHQQSFEQKYPRNPNSTCKCEHWQACIDCHPTYQDLEHKVYTSPPQRPWVGLEAEEILDLFDRNNVYGSKWIEFARTVEAKLKEKNGH